MYKPLAILGKRRVLFVVVGALTVIIVLQTLRQSADGRVTDAIRFGGSGEHSDSRPQLPAEYKDADAAPAAPTPQSEYCDERFTPRFLDDFRAHMINYCDQDPESNAKLHCFQGHSHPSGEVDTFCLAKGAVLDAEKGKFALDCRVRAPQSNESVTPFKTIKGYWYDTGPRQIFDHALHVAHPQDVHPPESTSSPADFLLMVKREGAPGNLWHTLMEIWSMTMTFDVLRSTPDPDRSEGAPFFSDRFDLANTQAIMVDDHETGLDEGELQGLWTMFTGRPPLRLKEIVDDPEKRRVFSESAHNIIVPLAGAANPLWQNDWTEHDCFNAPNLHVFVGRVMRYFNVPVADPKPKWSSSTISAKFGLLSDEKNNKKIITFINRQGTRRLVDHDQLFEALVAKHEDVMVQQVDFAEKPLREQLELVQGTDVLVGVHGAGLTHTMFMREGEGAVVEIKPETMNYRGFRNLAVMKKLQYFEAKGKQIEQPKNSRRDVDELVPAMNGTLVKRANWHGDDIRIEEADFLALLEKAISAVS